jgi:N-acetylgalactosamine kinase
MTKVQTWLHAFDDKRCFEWLSSIYGEDEALLRERRARYVEALQAFAKVFGSDAEVVIARAPGRINLMGRHIDHRGGHVNPMALNVETLMVAQPRDDDEVVAHNVESVFPPRRFRIGEEIPPTKIRDLSEWDAWTMGKFRERQAAGTDKDWINYLKAAAVYFQDLVREEKTLRGLNVMVDGNVPRSAGLASSSALFMAAAEALLRVNRVTLEPPEFVEHCGRGEWYVGTRGGSGDHAAIKFGRRGCVSHIGFFPSTVKHVPFPSAYRVIIANSREEAHKAGGARNRFNQCVACYEFGFMLIQENFPEHAPKLERLRDVNAGHLGVSEAEIERMLDSLPERATRDELFRALPASHHARLREIFAQHDEPADGYPIRDVCLFGVAECHRSRLCFDLLERGDLQGFGALMNVSHDGDRVAFNDQYPMRNVQRPTPLYLRPGAYACSTPRIDRLVDIALGVDGVMGAQLSGAGLGGCIMILARREAVESVRVALEEHYYRPLRREPGVYVCVPVEGSGVLTKPQT